MSGSSRRAAAAIVLGSLAVAAIPVGVAAAWRLEDVDLLQAVEIAVAVAIVLGLLAVSVGRRARYRVDRSVSRRGEGVVRVARAVAWLGLYLGISGAVALGFYGLLVIRG
jgi:hypothetical protein